MYAPVFTITPRLLALTAEASEMKNWVQASLIDVAWAPLLQKDAATRLSHSSTAIEGNPLTLPEVEALARGENIVSSAKAAKEVLNYLSALKWIAAQRQNAVLSEKTLLFMHRLLAQGLLPANECGQYKTRPNRIVDHKGITVYSPPSPEQAPLLTRDLIAWTNAAGAQKLHAVIVSAIVHHRLVSIHPFSDGNGRVARTLGIWVSYTRGFDTRHVLALDEHFEEDRQLYYEKIQQARDLDDDLTFWLEYTAEGLLSALHRTKRRIQSLQIRHKGSKFLLTKRQEDLLRLLRDRGRIKSPDVEKVFHISRARVGQIIQPLVKAGLVIQEGRTRATSYRLETR